MFLTRGCINSYKPYPLWKVRRLKKDHAAATHYGPFQRANDCSYQIDVWVQKVRPMAADSCVDRGTRYCTSTFILSNGARSNEGPSVRVYSTLDSSVISVCFFLQTDIYVVPRLRQGVKVRIGRRHYLKAQNTKVQQFYTSCSLFRYPTRLVCCNVSISVWHRDVVDSLVMISRFHRKPWMTKIYYMINAFM